MRATLDKFESYRTYAGRVYPWGGDDGEEVLSVGLEHLWINPEEAALKDPEWFEPVITLLKRV